MITLIFWLAVVGAVFDWRYMRVGGLRPTKDEKRYLAMAIGLCVIALIALAMRGADAGGIGNVTSFLVSVVFGLWELQRFRLRRANPPPYRPTPQRH